MDNILPGYHEIGGTGVTMADCIRYILGFQSVQRWQLGRCDFNTQFQYSFSSAYLLNALLALPKQLTEDWQLTTDTTTWPWTLNLIRPSATVECELRYQHNMALDSSRINKKGYHTAYCVRLEECIGCAFCATMCPDVAITVEK